MSSSLDTTLTILIVVSASVLTSLILSWLIGRQRRAEKKEDYRRSDLVVSQAAEAAELLKRQQDEMALQARQVAKLLAEGGSITSPEHLAKIRNLGIDVTIAFRSGAREDAVLVGVPQVGEKIRLDRDNPTTPALYVEEVVWMEALHGQPPHVVVSVRPCGQKPPAAASTDPKG